MATASSGNLVFNIPNFERDIAVKAHFQGTAPTPPGTEVKLNPVEVTGSSNINPSYPAANVNDGSTGTYSVTNWVTPTNAWILYRFDSSVNFSKIKWHTMVSNCAPDVDIQISDDGTGFTVDYKAILK